MVFRESKRCQRSRAGGAAGTALGKFVRTFLPCQTGCADFAIFRRSGPTWTSGSRCRCRTLRLECSRFRVRGGRIHEWDASDETWWRSMDGTWVEGCRTCLHSARELSPAAHTALKRAFPPPRSGPRHTAARSAGIRRENKAAARSCAQNCKDITLALAEF